MTYLIFQWQTQYSKKLHNQLQLLIEIPMKLKSNMRKLYKNLELLTQLTQKDIEKIMV